MTPSHEASGGAKSGDAALSEGTMFGETDTIVAIATAPGRGALATIRISGPNARQVAQRVGAHDVVANNYMPRTAKRVMLHHPRTGEPLDDALATLFAAPRSFTGDDLLELSVHGGVVVPSAVLAACIAAGCRMAYPGEFTRRAVMNGHIDIVQAEAIADLIDARTTAMSRQALAQLDGGLSRRIAALREKVIGLEALIAYDIDFPGEDDGPIAAERIINAAASVLVAIDALLATSPRAAIIRDGALVVVAGPPNAGKSSLFNALLGEGRAIVTEIPGTTRDAIEALLDRAPTPLRLVDTAGLRDTSDPIERLGIETSTRYLGRAHVVLACGASDEDVARTAAVIAQHSEGVVVPVRTKIDLDPVSSVAQQVSAETGEGLAELLLHLDRVLAGAAADAGEAPVIVTRERHRMALAEARAELAQFLTAWSDQGLPATVTATHLLAAREALGDVTGAIMLDDVLDRVFRDFCIGK